MIKIIAGNYGSRNIKTLKGDNTRPTSIKVRGAVFSKIGPYFNGGKVLDLFAGSGAFGIEALSRGMDEAYFVDDSLKAINIIKENIKIVKEKTHIIKDGYKKALLNLKGEKFNLIFLDPPYDLKIIEEIILEIDTNELLDKNGIIVCETLKEDKLKNKIGAFIKEKESFYGISKITYYKGE